MDENINASLEVGASNIRLTSTWRNQEYISISLVVLFVPFILCSNIMVIMSVIKFKRLQIPTNYFIMSLSIADIVIAIMLPLYVTVELTSIKISDSILCLAPNRVLMTAGGVSILTLSTIAFDRFTAITHPLEYIMLMTKGKILGLILFSWAYSFTICWIPIFVHWHENVIEHFSFCSSSILDRKARLLFLSVLFTPACFSILFFYCKIFLIARHHSRAIAAVENSIQYRLERHFVSSDTKYAKTIAVLIGVFLCLWLPYQIYLFLNIVGYSEQDQWVTNYLMLLAFLNSGINPWVYAYQNKDFRSAYKKIYDTCKCRRSRDIEDRRTSIESTISVIPSTSTTAQLNRTNSRVIASDFLYTIGREIGKGSVEQALNSTLSAKDCTVNASSSLPSWLKLCMNSCKTSPVIHLSIIQESICTESKDLEDDSKDSAFSGSSELLSDTTL